MKILKNILTVFFLIFISTHFLLFLILKKESTDFIQNRKNTTIPIYDGGEKSIYIKKCFEYVEDHFPFKNNYIKQSNLVKGVYFKSFNAKSKVIVGKNGWLYYNSCIYDENGLNEYAGYNNWNNEQISTVVKNINVLKLWCAKNKIHFEIIICPNKQTIYPEFLPNNYKKRHDNRLNQLTKASPDILNLEAIFDIHKKIYPKQLLYYKTDTHWNQYGALIAMKALRKRLISDFPFIDDLSFTIKDSLIHNGNDLANLIALNDFYEDTYPIITFKNKNPIKIAHLVILNDSFLSSMEISLNQLFTKVTQRHLFVEGFPSPQYLLENKTDVFIIESVERYKEILTGNIHPDFYK